MVAELELVRVSVLNKDTIHLGYNLMQHMVTDLLHYFGADADTFVIVTDVHLAQLHLPPLVAVFKDHLKQEGQRLLVRVIPAGEGSKSRSTKEELEYYLLDHGCTRNSTCLIALGGGVVGDLVGFVGSTFMRGVPVVQVPTTLLAMVDSSVGGKTAVDTHHGKNLIGSFWQPERIYMNLSFLSTLPKRELANGMAEVIKTAAVWNQADFERLEKDAENVIKAAITQHPRENEIDVLIHAILSSVSVKAEVVSNDERESGLRSLLNFGHTLGHAIEALMAPDWLHGECVSMGMLLETEIAVELGHCDRSTLDRLRQCLAQYHLPVAFDDALSRSRLTVENLMRVMKVDKKNDKRSRKRIVLLSRIGATVEKKASCVTDAVIRKVLHRYLGPTRKEIPTRSTKEVSEAANITPTTTLVLCSSSTECHAWIMQVLCPALGAHYRSLARSLEDVVSGDPGRLLVLDDQELAEEAILQLGQKYKAVHFTFEPASTALDPSLEWYEYVLVRDEEGNPAAMQVSGAISFLHGLAGLRPRHLSPASGPSYFVTPTVSDYASVPPFLMSQWLENANAIELRVDLLELGTQSSWITTAGVQLAHLRARTTLPVVFTVRTKPQAGHFDSSDTHTIHELVVWAHRWGCEYVDVEFTTLSSKQLERLTALNKTLFSGSVQIIASFHDPQRAYPWSSQALHDIYERAQALLVGPTSRGVIKLVGMAHSMQDNFELAQFRARVDPLGDKQLILINMGAPGRLSRVTNHFMTPATHPLLPSPAAAGQLSIAQLIRLRNDLSI